MKLKQINADAYESLDRINLRTEIFYNPAMKEKR